MNTFIIYAFDNDVIEFELVQDTSIPDQLPVCLFFFFIQGIYDHQSQVFLESHLLTNYYYVNAKIIPSKFIETHFSGKQLDSLRENIDKWEDKELTIIKLNNGEAHVTNAEEIEIYTVTSNPHIKLSQEMINGNYRLAVILAASFFGISFWGFSVRESLKCISERILWTKNLFLSRYLMSHSESDTRAKYIDPKLKLNGREENSIIREHYFTDGRKLVGNKRGPRCFADYILRYNGINLAIIEAKSDDKEPTEGSVSFALDWLIIPQTLDA